MEEETDHFVPIAQERGDNSPVSPADIDTYDQDFQASQRRQSPYNEYSESKENVPDFKANFDSADALRTVIRRDGSPVLSSERKRMLEYVPDDSEELFTPAKALNFTDADETGTDVGFDDQPGQDVSVDRYMESNGIDLMNFGSLGSGSQRIIEGHDSSPLDQRVVVTVAPDQVPASSAHASSVHMSSVSVSPGASHLCKLSVESQEISPHLYDSLDEKEEQVYHYGGQIQSQKEPSYAQRSVPSVFSPVQSPHHATLSSSKEPRNIVLGGSSLPSSNVLAHSSPQSEPPLTSYAGRNDDHMETMSHSLPERINQNNFEGFGEHLQHKSKDSALQVPGSLSEWVTPNVCTVDTIPAKAPVNHIALNIQRVKNASKLNKTESAKSQNNGDCPRLNRVDQKPIGGKNQTQNPVRRPISNQSSGQARPKVQGSADLDQRHFVTNQRQGQQGQMSKVQDQSVKVTSHPDKGSLSGSVVTSGRYGGVGSEIKTNMGHRNDVSNSPGSRMRYDQDKGVVYSGPESREFPSSYMRQNYHDSNISPRMYDHEAVSTQVGQMKSPESLGYSFSPQQERTRAGDVAQDIHGMEGVRSHLQSMLRLSNDVMKAESGKFDHSDTASQLLMDQPLNRQLKFDTSSFMGPRVQEEVSELFESFPNFSSKIFSDLSATSVGRQEGSVHNENVYLREVMEKERYRRKHCEQHIQQLNAKLLETQQQLAVAVSTDKKKDIMIEQLDKQLAKVVEGWKKREREKDDYMKLLLKEKSQIEQSLKNQQEMINNFEKEMAETVSALKREKQHSAMAVEDLKRELETKIREKVQAEEVLEGERERASLVMQEWEQLKEARELAENRAQQLQDRLHQEQDDWYKREQELLGKIDDVKEANLKVIQMERLKTEETERRVSELEERNRLLETESKKLDLEFDEARREKESLKVEMAILEAKFESSQRKIEADLHSQMEKEISEQVGEVHEKMEEALEELQEKHRRQVAEIHSRHQKDTERQMQQMRDDGRRTEDNYRQKIQELEERLEEYRNENSSLKHSKQKLESQRMEILTKFQYMMQSQWNEAVSLLVNTPQRKSQPLNGSFVSSISHVTQSQAANPPGQLNLSIVNSNQPKTSSPNREEEARPPVRLEEGGMEQHRVAETDRVEEYINSLPTSNSSAQQGNQDFIVTGGGGLHNQSFSSGASNSQLPRHPSDVDTAGTVLDNRLQGMTFPELNLNDSLLPHLHNQGLQIPQNIHGYLLSHGSVNPANQSVHLQTLANHNQALLNLVSQPGAAVMLQPPQQQSHVYSQSQVWGQVPPSPSKHRSQRKMQKSKDSQVRSDYEDSDDDSVTPRGGYTHPAMSPPVKQSRQSQEEEGYNPRHTHREPSTVDNLSDTLEQTVRLNADYSQIADRVAEHESRQNELQHYIKMLLDRPPGDVTETPEHDIPVGSDILETSREMTVELDLNDTAQAAQLNRELQRLQQLRDQVTQRDRLLGSLPPERDDAHQSSNRQGGSRVLAPEQLAEISRLLDQYREQGDQHSGEDSVNRLLQLLQGHTQHFPEHTEGEQKSASVTGKQSPRSGRKTKTAVSVNQKKPPTARANPAAQGKVLDTSQTKSDAGQSSKSQPLKKVERKLACNKPSQAKGKSSAWK
ncbi:interaptin-like [Haliotis asinina]|uniref:interaptin-like n=1 Tax=Haliotis asinina TaxID=109174 RepID=UPI003531860E